MEVSPAGNVMLLRLLHLEKASLSMEVTPSGKVILVRRLHPKKAYPPMEVTPAGKVMLGGRSVLRSWKVQSSMRPCASTCPLACSSARDQVGRLGTGMVAPAVGSGWVVEGAGNTPCVGAASSPVGCGAGAASESAPCPLRRQAAAALPPPSALLPDAGACAPATVGSFNSGVGSVEPTAAPMW